MNFRSINIELDERIKDMYDKLCPKSSSGNIERLLSVMPSNIEIKVVNNIQRYYTLKFRHFTVNVRNTYLSMSIRYLKNYNTTLYNLNLRDSRHVALFLTSLDDIFPEWHKELSELEQKRRRRNEAWSRFKNAELWIHSNYDDDTNIEQMPYVYYNSRAAYIMMHDRDEPWTNLNSLDEIVHELNSKGIEIDKNEWQKEVENAIAEGKAKWIERKTLAEQQIKNSAQKTHQVRLQSMKAKVLVRIAEEKLGCKFDTDIRDNYRELSLKDTFFLLKYKIFNKIIIELEIPLNNLEESLREALSAMEESIKLEKTITPLLSGKKYSVYLNSDDEYSDRIYFVLGIRKKHKIPQLYKIEGNELIPTDSYHIKRVKVEPISQYVNELNLIAKKHNAMRYYVSGAFDD